jgi:hypothetical protein
MTRPAEEGPGVPAAAPGTGNDAATGRSGLRNPAAAARGLGAGALILETVVLLLAIQPIRVLGGGLSGSAVLVLCALAGAAVLLSSVLRHRWAWHAGGALQLLVIAAGLLHVSLAVVGAVFGGVWLYVLHVRRTILR